VNLLVSECCDRIESVQPEIKPPLVCGKTTDPYPQVIVADMRSKDEILDSIDYLA